MIWIYEFLEPESLPTILRRVAYPIEPFRFEFVPDDLSPPVLAGIGERSGKQPGLFNQVDDCQANDLQRSHRVLASCRITAVTSEIWDDSPSPIGWERAGVHCH